MWFWTTRSKNILKIKYFYKFDWLLLSPLFLCYWFPCQTNHPQLIIPCFSYLWECIIHTWWLYSRASLFEVWSVVKFTEELIRNALIGCTQTYSIRICIFKMIGFHFWSLRNIPLGISLLLLFRTIVFSPSCTLESPGRLSKSIVLWPDLIPDYIRIGKVAQASVYFKDPQMIPMCNQCWNPLVWIRITWWDSFF